MKKIKSSSSIILGTLITSNVVLSAASNTGNATLGAGPLLVNTLSTAGAAAKCGLDVFLALTKTVVSAFSVPILLAMLSKVIYHNYFVLQGGKVQNVIGNVAGLPFKVISYIRSFCKDKLKDNDKKTKGSGSEEKSDQKIISLYELEKEIKDLEKPEKFDEKKINELLRRIWVTRGVFSDLNYKSLSSWGNAFWYYLTTAVFFYKTRGKFNEFEEKLKKYKTYCKSIEEIEAFISSLKFNSVKGISLDNLFGSAKEENTFYGNLEKIFKSIQDLKKNIKDTAESLEQKLKSGYLDLISDTIVDQLKNEVCNIDGISGIIKTLSGNKSIESFKKIFPKEGVSLLNTLCHQLETVKSMMEINKKTEEVLAKIDVNFHKNNLKEKVEKIFEVLKERGNLEKICAFFFGDEGKNLDDTQIDLLIKIVDNYAELEKCYKLYGKIKVTDDNIFDFNDVIKKFNNNFSILRMICGDNQDQALLKSAIALRSARKLIDSIDENFKTNIEHLNPDECNFSSYCKDVEKYIGNAVEDLRENYNKNFVNQKDKLKNIVESKFKEKLNNYTKKQNQITEVAEAVTKYTEGTFLKIQEVDFMKYSDENELEKSARDICDSKNIEEKLNKIEDSLYKEKIVSLFHKYKDELVLTIKEKLKSSFGINRSVIQQFVDTVQSAKKFLGDVGKVNGHIIGNMSIIYEKMKSSREQLSKIPKYKDYVSSIGKLDWNEVDNIFSCIEQYQKIEKCRKSEEFDIESFLFTVDASLYTFSTANNILYFEGFCNYIAGVIKEDFEDDIADKKGDLEKISQKLPEKIGRVFEKKVLSSIKFERNNKKEAFDFFDFGLGEDKPERTNYLRI